MPDPVTRCLSVRQPWASLIMSGVKRFEVRSWRPDFTGSIALHASSGNAPGWKKLSAHPMVMKAIKLAKLPEDPKEWPRGILGVVDIVDYVEAEWPEDYTLIDLALCGDPWADGDVRWRLGRPRPLAKPIPCDGKLNLWTLSPKLQRNVQEGLER